MPDKEDLAELHEWLRENPDKFVEFVGFLNEKSGGFMSLPYACAIMGIPAIKQLRSEGKIHTERYMGFDVFLVKPGKE